MRKPFAVFLVCLVGLIGAVRGQEMPLSPTATASIITCGLGNDFYTTFGHSAIRITDTAQGIDVVYNYGTFDFSTPHFYWQFTRGRLDYHLSRSSFASFMATYQYEQRAVWEQPLLLSNKEVNNLFVLLENNYLPEYRYYRYDFFRDNCATRVRDMIDAACGHSPILYYEGETPKWPSYRNFVHNATGPTLQWWALGIDLLLGLPADHRCNTEETMFYPINMMFVYELATRNDAPLTGAIEKLLPDTREPLHRSFPPLVAFLLLMVAVGVLSVWQLKARRSSVATSIADRVLMVVAGLVGLFLIFMWVGTDHYCTAWNLNILWASPLLLLIAIRLERSPRWALWLQEGCFAVALVWVLWCGLSWALIPIILTLAMRVAMCLCMKRYL